MSGLHVPVLLQEVLVALQPRAGMTIVDGTVGHGGHAQALLEAIAPDGLLVGIDRDERNLALARKRLASFGDRAVLLRGTYAHVDQMLDELEVEQVHGILLDLGYSSAHVDDPERGFSFQSDGPLDMRYDTDQAQTAAEIVNRWNVPNLTNLFVRYGEERRARRIAEAIVRARVLQPILTTMHLAEIVERVVPRHGKTHPATQVFQALRVAVNDELAMLEAALPRMVDRLQVGGRLAVITFHSLEDRVVKQVFRTHPLLRRLTKKPVIPTEIERKQNPRSRSAKLRVAEKTNKESYDDVPERSSFNLLDFATSDLGIPTDKGLGSSGSRLARRPVRRVRDIDGTHR